MSIRFVHAADFHLDSPFDGLTGQQAVQRRREQRSFLKSLAELVRREQAQLLLLSGDLLDSSNAFGETVECLQEFFASLSIPIFVAPGNHDCVSRLSPYLRMSLPENVHIFTQPEIRHVSLPDLGVRVWGAGYQDKSCPPLLRYFEAAKDGDILDILVLHGEVGRPNSAYCPITEEELSHSGMDYVALGHIHQFSGLRRVEDCFYAWPGCIEGRGFDECGEKGVIVGELSPGSCNIHFVPMGGRRYVNIRISVGENPLEDILARLPAETSRDIYRLTLTGERKNALNLSVLKEALEPRFYSLSLVDATEPKRNLWARAGENTLHGQFLQRMQQRISESDDPQQRMRWMMAVRAGLAALDGREEPF